MRSRRSAHPVFLVLLAALAVVLVGELSRPEARGGETGADIGDELLLVQAEETSGAQILVLCDVSTRKLMAYKMSGSNLVFVAWRNYKYDLALDEWPLAKGGQAAETDALQMKRLWEQTDDYKDAKKKKEVKDVVEYVEKRIQPSKGQTRFMGVTAPGGGPGRSGIPSHLYLVDRANKKILVYQMMADTLKLVAVRKTEYDEKLLEHDSSGSSPSFRSYHEIKKLVEDAEKKDKEKKD